MSPLEMSHGLVDPKHQWRYVGILTSNCGCRAPEHTDGGTNARDKSDRRAP